MNCPFLWRYLWIICEEGLINPKYCFYPFKQLEETTQILFSITILWIDRHNKAFSIQRVKNISGYRVWGIRGCLSPTDLGADSRGDQRQYWQTISRPRITGIHRRASGLVLEWTLNRNVENRAANDPSVFTVTGES